MIRTKVKKTKKTITEPSTARLEKYVQALDELENELVSKYGESLGIGPNSPLGKIQKEREKALRDLARLKIDSINPY